MVVKSFRTQPTTVNRKSQDETYLDLSELKRPPRLRVTCLHFMALNVEFEYPFFRENGYEHGIRFGLE